MTYLGWLVSRVMTFLKQITNFHDLWSAVRQHGTLSLPFLCACPADLIAMYANDYNVRGHLVYKTAQLDIFGPYQWLADQTVFYCQKVAPLAQHPPATPALPLLVSWSLTAAAAGCHFPHTAASCYALACQQSSRISHHTLLD